MKNYTITGIDLAKRIMHITTVNEEGSILFKKKVKREELLPYINTLDKTTIIAMEACSSCNYWSQEISNYGYQVKLMKTKDVKTYAASKQKNDFNDALAICKAAKDPELKVVKAKSKEEQDVSLLHKARDNAISARVSKTNSLISSLYEYGYLTKLSQKLFVSKCSQEIEQAYKDKLLSKVAYQVLIGECEELQRLYNREKLLKKAITVQSKTNEKAKKLQKITGIGPINASYLSIAPMETYPTAKDFAASLGIVPRQHSSGDKIVLGKITKQGDRYARTMLIQAGRSIAIQAKRKKQTATANDRLVLWAKKKFAENKPFNVIAVALANKLARTAYAVIVNNTEYQSN
jgi:transposase